LFKQVREKKGRGGGGTKGVRKEVSLSNIGKKKILGTKKLRKAWLTWRLKKKGSWSREGFIKNSQNKKKGDAE